MMNMKLRAELQSLLLREGFRTSTIRSRNVYSLRITPKRICMVEMFPDKKSSYLLVKVKMVSTTNIDREFLSILYERHSVEDVVTLMSSISEAIKFYQQEEQYA